MKMNFRRLFFIVILVTALSGCQHAVKQIDSSPKPTDTLPVFISEPMEAAKPWTDLGFLNDPNNFQFAIISDLHGGYRPGIFEEAVKKINLMQPEFVLSIGDLIAGYTEDETAINQQWAKFEELIAPLGMKFFFVPGNHDMSNVVMTKKWEERFGRSYYHFIYRNVLFLCLNSEDPPDTHISDAQIEYVRKVLAENPNVRWTFTFIHKPLWLNENTGWEKIEAMLAERPHTVLAGHIHSYVKYKRHGQSYIRLATTGGASALRGSAVGEFDHITWVTMTDKEPIIANLALDGILDENIVTEESLRVIMPFRNGSWLTSDGIVLETTRFKEGTTVFRLSNPGSNPLKVSGAFKQHSQLNVAPMEIDLSIAPESTENIPVNISTENPVELSELDPLELEITAVYDAPDRPPISSKSTHRVDFRSMWQGPELIRNGHFSRGLEAWDIAQKTHESGTASVLSEALKVSVARMDPRWALVVYQPVGTLKPGIDYQLSFKAKNHGGPGIIGARIFNSTSNVTIRVDGQVKEAHLMTLTESMEPHIMNFRINQETDLKGSMFMFVFSQAKEVTIDNVSLRSIQADLKQK